MQIRSGFAASMMALSMASAIAQPSEPFKITARAFTPGGVPLGEQTDIWSPAKACRFTWQIESDNQFKAVTLIVKESQPGYLLATAMHGLASHSVRLFNKVGSSGHVNAVRSSPTAADVVLMKFEIERR